MLRKGRIDYRMQRRALLRQLASGARAGDEVRDGHPDLYRAAQHLGTPMDQSCPLCERELTKVIYVFDDPVRHPGGRAVPAESLPGHVDRFGQVRVFEVEACCGCHWHHLIESYDLCARDTDVSAG